MIHETLDGDETQTANEHKPVLVVGNGKPLGNTENELRKNPESVIFKKYRLVALMLEASVEQLKPANDFKLTAVIIIIEDNG